MSERLRPLPNYLQCCLEYPRVWSSDLSRFVLYTADVLQLVKDHGLLPHAYADDILGVCCPSETDELQHRVSDCLEAVSLWMAANHLHLNHEKTEALWCSSACRQHQIPTTPVRVGCSSVQPDTAARNLGIYLDGDVSMRTHVTTNVRACFAMLRQIRSVRLLCHVQPC